MVATQAAMREDPRHVVEEMTAVMEASARNGDWERVEELAARLQMAVMAVPESARRAALEEAQRSMDQVRSLAVKARSEVTGRLSALKRGQHATRAYTEID